MSTSTDYSLIGMCLAGAALTVFVGLLTRPTTPRLLVLGPCLYPLVQVLVLPSWWLVRGWNATEGVSSLVFASSSVEYFERSFWYAYVSIACGLPLWALAARFTAWPSRMPVRQEMAAPGGAPFGPAPRSKVMLLAAPTVSWALVKMLVVVGVPIGPLRVLGASSAICSFVISSLCFRGEVSRLTLLATTAVPVVADVVGGYAAFELPLVAILGGALYSQASFRRRSVRSLVLGSVLFFALMFWQSAKGTYRQAVVERGQEIATLQGFWEFAGSEVSLSDLIDLDVLDGTARRLSTVTFTSAAIEHVPRVVPHQGGAVLLDSALFALAPRFLFSGKGLINDTDRIDEFTSLRVSRNASFSLGLLSLLYVDFGAVGGVLAFLVWVSMLSAVFTLMSRSLRAVGAPFFVGVLFVYGWDAFNLERDYIAALHRALWFALIHGVALVPIYRSLGSAARGRLECASRS